ncbi:terpenoid synthase [Fomes fomentarius]|nr:terpenoid synthase [Fomes fomentarius]
MLSWQSADTEEILAKFAETACDYTETGYGHLSPVHQHFVALYTAIILYIDDIGEQHLDALKQFASRLTCGEKQLCPALDALVHLLRQAHELWTDVGADAIIAGTLDTVTAMYIENTTRDMEIKPKATLYPYYLRTRSGICPPYIHFIFMKHWRPTTESYLQMLPYMERWVVGANLSFYKEELAGETKNYIHMCAAAEQVTPADALRALANEVLNHTHTIKTLAGEDIELASLWEQYVQRVLEFHINARRYRLSELDLEAVYGQRADGGTH